VPFVRPFQGSYRVVWAPFSFDGGVSENSSVKIDNSFIERVKEFKYVGTTLTDQNSIQKEIKSRLKLGNACYHAVQNLLSSRV
jgi:hypothetical protein